MRGRRPKLSRELAVTMHSTEVKPILFDNPHNKHYKHSKVIRVYLNNESDYQIGYYDYNLCSFFLYKGTEQNPKAKSKVTDNQMIGWQYV